MTIDGGHNRNSTTRANQNGPQEYGFRGNARNLDHYKKLDAAYPEITLREAGTTDIGQPLHEVVVSLDGDADPASVRAKNRRVVFIQNGIHPGEPEGIDASMMLVRDYGRGTEPQQHHPRQPKWPPGIWLPRQRPQPRSL